MSLGLEVLQPLNGKRAASYRCDSFEEGAILAKRFCDGKHHQSLQQHLQPQAPDQMNTSAQQHSISEAVTIVSNPTQQKPSIEATVSEQMVTSSNVPSSKSLTADEMTAWIVHGGYSPTVVQSYCRPDACVMYRGDCY